MFLWARLPETYDTTALLRRVVRAGAWRTCPVRRSTRASPTPSTLRLCFVTQTPEEIREGLRRLGAGLAAAGEPPPEPAESPGEGVGHGLLPVRDA